VATRVLPLCLLGACHGGGRTADAARAVAVANGPVLVRTVPPAEAALLEAGGIPPGDTSLVVTRGRARTLILRHGPPDRAEFLELTLPATVFQDAPAETVHVTARPLPGVYGVTLEADAPWGKGAELAFKYAVHFNTPPDALARYRTLTEVERRLVIARRGEGGDAAIYYSTHPFPDVVLAKIPGPGTYQMLVGK
jgi:hypothetical protein